MSFSIYPIIRKYDWKNIYWKKRTRRVSKWRINDPKRIVHDCKFILFLSLTSLSLDLLYIPLYNCFRSKLRLNYEILHFMIILRGGEEEKEKGRSASCEKYGGHGNRNRTSSITECSEGRIWPNSVRSRA